MAINDIILYTHHTLTPYQFILFLLLFKLHLSQSFQRNIESLGNSINENIKTFQI